MIIEYAKIEDAEIGVKLLNEHLKEFDFGQKIKRDNQEYYKVLLTTLIKDKTIIVARDNNEIIGTLICARVPNIWDPRHSQLHILATWVRDDKRGSSVFIRMNKFMEKEFINMDKVYVKLSSGKTNINYNKLGYRKSCSNYIKESN